MTSPLNVVAQEHSIASGVQDPEAIAKALQDILADTYRLMFKTHAYHWNVEGPLFFSLHKLTEEQYENLFSARTLWLNAFARLGSWRRPTCRQSCPPRSSKTWSTSHRQEKCVLIWPTIMPVSRTVSML